jgi:hypothetical protein
MFALYLFENRQTKKYVSVGGWSYVWAGLFGPLYVLAKGGRSSTFRSLVLTVFLTLILVGLVAVTSYIPAIQQVIVVMGAIPVVLLVQSVKTVEILKNTYRLRGWKIRTGD